MRKAGTDPKVKKTLIRNYEQKVRIKPKSAQDREAGPSNLEKPTRRKKDHDLDEPTLCSSETLANYLTDARNSSAPLAKDKLNFDKTEINAQVTKKLNFHINDRMYKNLVELNIDVAKLKNNKDRKTVKSAPVKRDIEPNIEDFCQDEKENDLLFINIPDVKPKLKPVRRIEDGRLHRLVASFEKL